MNCPKCKSENVVYVGSVLADWGPFLTQIQTEILWASVDTAGRSRYICAHYPSQYYDEDGENRQPEQYPDVSGTLTTVMERVTGKPVDRVKISLDKHKNYLAVWLCVDCYCRFEVSWHEPCDWEYPDVKYRR